MSQQRVARNALFAVGQAIASAAILLVTYRIMMDWLTIEQIGLWSLIMGATTLARLSEFGLGAGALRFVAADLAGGRPERAARTIAMAALAVLLLVGTLALVLFPWIHSYVRAIATPALAPAVDRLLPAAMAGLVLSAVANVFLNAIDGMQRIDVRARLQVVVSLVQLLAIWLIVPVQGLAGLALVALAQAGFQLVCALSIAAAMLRQPLASYLRFERRRFGELVRYGGAMQLGGLAQLLFEPLVKVLLAGFSGLALTGYFDMANRIVLQARSIIVTAFSALVPHIAARSGEAADNREAVAGTYREAMDTLLLTGLPFLACVAGAMPLALTLWKGQYEAVFLAVAIVQLAAWSLNLLTAPSYLIYTGLGQLRWVVGAHIAIGVVTLVLGPALGLAFGGPGVLGAAAVGLVLGSLVTMAAFHRQYGLGWTALSASRRLPLILLLGAAMLGAVVIAWLLTEPGWVVLIGMPAIVGLLATALFWIDPGRPTLIGRLRGAISRRA
jgi:O-antigen/teichoic acid export membrane protein